MNNEVFRFSVLRPFQKVGRNQLRSKVIEYQPVHRTSKLFQDLATARGKEDLAAMVAATTAFRKTPTFVKGLSGLPWPLEKLDDRLSGWTPSKPPLEATVDAVFKEAGINDWKAWIRNAANRATIDNLFDSLLAVSLRLGDDAQVRAIRPVLIRAIRLCTLVDRLAAGDAELDRTLAIPRALSALVLLPKELFPLPPKGWKQEWQQAQKEYEASKKASDEQRNKVLDLAKRLEGLQSAKAELDDLHRLVVKPERAAAAQANLADTKSRQKPSAFSWFGTGASNVAADPDFAIHQDASWKLTQAASQKLSEPSKAALRSIGLNLEMVDVRTASHEIQRQTASISKQVQSTKPGAGTVKIGGSFVPKGILFPKPPRYTFPGRAGAGDITVDVPAAPSPPRNVATTVPSGHGTVQPVGYQELILVWEQVLKYLPGEVAHIENVLEGEEKERTHRKRVETEDTTRTETERITDTQRDLQSTNRFELQVNAQKVVDEKIGVEVGVSGSYTGPCYEVKANAGFTYDRAVQETTSKATSVAQEIVDRTVTKIHDRVEEERTRRVLEVVEEPKGHIRGIYRWVDKLHKMEAVSLGRRLMFEFVIPEPAAFYKYAQTNRPAPGVTMERPDPPIYEAPSAGFSLANLLRLNAADSEPRQLRPEDVTEHNYEYWVSKYNVQDVSPPPAEFKTIGIAISEKPPSGGNEVVQKIESLAVEEGYGAESAYVGGTEIPHREGYLRISVGKYCCEVRSSNRELEMSGESGSIPITAIYYNMAAIGTTVEVTCRRTPAAYEDWQLKTYASIMNAYQELNARYNEQVEAAETRAGIVVQGRNPAFNRGIERIELKKASITLVTAQHFETFDAMRAFGTPAYPQLDVAETTAEGPYIQFFEQSFEWQNINYIFYPYFWGRRSEWADTLNAADTDPKFEKFLQAGAARVLVPVRPGYEQAILHYLVTGEIWEGGDPPHASDNLFVPIVDAIKEEQGRFAKQGPGDLAVTKDSTTVKGVGTTFTDEDDAGREIFIRGKTYRIRRVEGLNQVQLERVYEDADEQNVPYELGVKYIGEPWEVRVPTSLVWLQKEPDLPDFTK